MATTDQRTFNKWLWDEAQLKWMDKGRQVYPTPPQEPATPSWFINFSKTSEKFICKLHDSFSGPIQCNLNPPNRRGNLCCPHVLEDISLGTDLFNVIISNRHEFFTPFDKELSALLGQTISVDNYTLVPYSHNDQTSFVIKTLKAHKIIQPISTALRVAHKRGLEGSFKRYDEIILHLATKVGDKRLTLDNLKTFDRYEKLRNLCLGSSGNERAVAGMKAYEVGRRLVNQLMEELKPKKSNSNEWTPCFTEDSYCDFCGLYPVGRLYKKTKISGIHNHTFLVYSCFDCISNGKANS